MRDPYIKRSAAQEALIALSVELDAETVRRCIEAIEKLPGEAVVLGCCYNTLWEERNIMEEQLRALGRRIGDFRPLPERGWRNIENDPPEDHEEVLVAIRATYRSGEPYYMQDVGCHAWGKWHASRLAGDNRVTHWAPLPSTEGLEEDYKTSRAECDG